MVLYTCERCGYSTKIKTHYKKHLYRKRPCPTKIGTKTVELLRIEFDKAQKKPGGLYYCEGCSASFTTRQAKYKHQKEQFCQSIQEQPPQELSKDQMMKLLQKKQEEWESEKQGLMKQIELLLTKVGNTYIGEQHINQQNIILNNFGDESIEYIKDMFYKTLIERGPFGSIPNLVKTIHFDKKHPENMNLKLENSKDSFIKVYKAGDWHNEDKTHTIQQLVDINFNRINHKYEAGIKQTLPTYKKTIYENYKNQMSTNLETHKTIQQKTEEILIGEPHTD